MDEEELKRAYGVEEVKAGIRDLGDEANPDLGPIPGEGDDELGEEELVWLALERARKGEAP
jgi:hypothetical protein